MATEKNRKKIIDALMALAADRPFNDIGLADIANAAEVGLSTMRDLYSGRADILADFSRHIDRSVLDGEVEPAEHTKRGRLLDVMMRRFDALGPYKEGLRGLARSARRDPRLALLLSQIVAGSNQWMLAAAGIPTTGWRGVLKAEALVVVYARTARVWLTDDDPGLGATMAALDKDLTRAEELAERCRRLGSLCEPFSRFGRRSRSDAGREAGEAV